MTAKPVLRADYYKSNAELIEACVRLRYLRPKRSTLDPTYGRGIWWKNWRPERLTTHDLKLDGTDFRNLPYPDESFKQIAFDPPYVSAGGRSTTTIQDFYNRFGLSGAPTSPESLQALINDGLTEMNRLCKVGGIILVKCQDYISSGHLWSGTYWTEQHARSLGLDVVDRLLHVRKSGGPQPQGRTRKGRDGKRIKTRQHHARANVSTLLILKKYLAGPETF